MKKFFSKLFKGDRREQDPVRFLSTEEYEEWYYSRPQAKSYMADQKIWVSLTDMIEYLKPKRIFEFSSGLGQVLAESVRRNLDITGSETSDYAIRNSLCKEKVIKIGEIPESKLPFEENSFDLVFSSEVMEHVKEEHTEAVIAELYRICSKFALLTINTFDPNQPGHINMHSREWWLEKFENAGFRHEDGLWKDLNKMKYLDWDIYVFRKPDSV